jgi:hypothetical protein
VQNDTKNDTHKTANTDHADLLAWSGTVPNERTEDGETSTEHASGVLRLEAIRNREDELLVSDDAGGVATLCAGAVGVLAGLQARKPFMSV